MAQSGPTPFYLLQPAFTTGEISKEVANRVDLEKYQFALLKAENCYIRPYGPVYRRSGTVYCNPTKYADKQCILVGFNFTNDLNYMLEIGHQYIRVHKNGTYIGVEMITPFTESDLTALRFAQSADVMYITSGKYPIKQLARYSETDWRLTDFEFSHVYYDSGLSINEITDAEITPSAISGTVTLTATVDIFTSKMVGGYIKLRQDMPSKTVTTNNGTTDAVLVGEQWKVISGGTWTGNFEIQKSIDGNTWEEYRKYSGTNNFNPTESGTVSEYIYLRVVCSISSGTCTVNLTALPYVHDGTAKITGYTDSKHITAVVNEDFGSTAATDDYQFGAWSDEFGYPKTVCFFQDRLCFGGTQKQPYMAWMSRSGDYPNFSTKKASGTLTNDSAIAVSFISRKQFSILHMVPSSDLVILTEGNEWIISGGEVVTPTNITPEMQTTRGCNSCEPLTIGSRIVFVQGRGSAVRDMGYSFETDSYGGMELTLLAGQIIKGIKIIDDAYKQEPDSIIYFVRSDGTIACLSYIREQEVYAWSTIKTDGEYEAVVNIPEGEEDSIYAVVKRMVNGKTVRYIERFDNNYDGDIPNDYVMLDCSKIFDFDTASDELTGLEYLKGKTVDIIGDGRPFKNYTVSDDGTITLPTKVNRAIVGLPYTMNIELPNIEVQLKDGTMQGRYKQVSEATLRIENSLGGSVGTTFDNQGDIQYDEFSAVSGLTLYSGDKVVTPPIGGFDRDGRLCITSREPYPFNLLAVIRKVTFGG